MALSTNSLLNDPEWIAFLNSHNIALYDPTEDTMDLEGGLLQDLQEAFKNNSYNYGVPIITANSQDPRIQNQPLDGRHRVLAVFLLAKRGIKVKFPRVEREEIADDDELRLRIGHYERQSRSKDSKKSRKREEENVGVVVERRMDKYGDKLPDYIRKKGYSCSSITNRLISECQSKRNRSAAKITRLSSKPLQPRPGLDSQSWSTRPVSEGIHAGVEVDYITTYSQKCPQCKSPLIIVTTTTGAVVEVKHAPTIKK